MEAHHEVIAYVGSADTARVVGEITRLCVNAGLERIAEAPVPVLGDSPPRDGLTMFAVLPGAPGWSVILSLPEQFLAERDVTDGQTRFIGLCNALSAPGVFREVNAGSDAASAFDAFGEITLSCDGRGAFRVSGYMWRAAHDADDAPDKAALLNWYGHALEEDAMQTVDLGLVEPWLPQDWAQDPEALRSDISEAVTGATLAQRLAGLDTSRHWREVWPWRLIEDAVRLGDHMPLRGGVILSFAPVGQGDATQPAAPALDAPSAELAARAAQGDAQAQYQVGLRLRTIAGPPYPEHDEISRRRLRAATWFRRAAEQGHATAQYWLARSHHLNEGACEDWSEAWRWAHLAEAQGLPEATAWLDEIVYGSETRRQMMRRMLERA